MLAPVSVLVFHLLFHTPLLPAETIQSLYGHPDVRVEQITRYVPEMIHLTKDFKAGDVVVFDLDNTIYRESQLLGTDEWFSHYLDQLEHQGLNREQAMKVVIPLNRAIKHRTKMRLMEDGVRDFIHDLQKRGILTLGLTARHPSIAESTIRHLESFDIDFRRSPFPSDSLSRFSIPRSPRKFLYKNGIMFCGSARKGVVLKNILIQTGHIPRKLAAIDDRIEHIESYVETTQDLGFKGLLIHYLRVREEPPFDPSIASTQLNVFTKLGIILNDDQAREFARDNPTFDANTLDWSCSKLFTR